jgi:hypothetical protein
VKECRGWRYSLEANGGAAFTEEIDNYNAKCGDVTGDWTGGLVEDSTVHQRALKNRTYLLSFCSIGSKSGKTVLDFLILDASNSIFF